MVILGVLLALLKYFHLTYWPNKGVKVPKCPLPWGNNFQMNMDVILQRKNVIDYCREQYHEMEGERLYGTYLTIIPQIVIKDPELMKHIFVKDFHLFVDRIGPDARKFLFAGEGADKIWAQQLSLAGADTWKDIRSTFSPIFTSGKLKAMVPLIENIQNKLMKALDLESKLNQEFDLKEIMSKFSMDSIASCVFGVDAESFSDIETPFVKNAKSCFRKTIGDIFRLGIMMIPFGMYLRKWFQIEIFKPKETHFFISVIKATLEQRNQSKERRNDLIDMMIDAMKNVQVEEEQKMESVTQYEKDTMLNHKGKRSYDELTLIATAMTLLVAGYDTTGQTMSYFCFEVARNPSIQRRLQDEIDEAMAENDGKLPGYNTLLNLPYLDMVFMETLRLYPAIGAITRAALDEYTIPGTNIHLKKGNEICMNVAGMHSDPKYYPNPGQFNPEHFSKDNKAKRHGYTFAGFGFGPRNCLGMRFAVLEAKMAIVALLSKYDLVCSENTIMGKVELDPASQFGGPKTPLYVKIRERT